MKKTRTAASLLAVVGLMALVACSGTDPDLGQTEGVDRASPSAPATTVDYSGPDSALATTFGEVETAEGITVGYLANSEAIVTVGETFAALRDEVEGSGGEVVGKDAQFDVDRQVTQFAELLEAQVDAIVVFPVSADSLGPSIEEAISQGVPVIAIDNPADPAGDTLPGVSGSVLMGRDHSTFMLAETIATEWPGATFVVMGTATPSAGIAYFAESAEAWGTELGLEFLGREDVSAITFDAAAQAMSSILTRFPAVEAVMTYNDDAALAASGIARANGREDILITGFNGEEAALEAIENGQLFATYEVALEGVGREAARGAILSAQGIEIPEVVVQLGTVAW